MLRPAAALLRSPALALVARSSPPRARLRRMRAGATTRLLMAAPLDAACPASALGTPRASADSFPPTPEGRCARVPPFRRPLALCCIAIMISFGICYQQSLLLGVSLPRQIPRVQHRVSTVRRLQHRPSISHRAPPPAGRPSAGQPSAEAIASERTKILTRFFRICASHSHTLNAGHAFSQATRSHNDF